MGKVIDRIKQTIERVKFCKQLSQTQVTQKGERSKRYLIEALDGDMNYRVEEFEELIEITAKRENLSRELAIKFILITLALVEGDKEAFRTYYTEDLAEALNATETDN